MRAASLRLPMLSRRFFACWLTLAVPLLGCREKSGSDSAEQRARALAQLAAASALAPRAPAPVGSAVVAFEKEVQRTKLSVPPRAQHEPRLVFAKDVLARLTRDALVIQRANDLAELLRAELEGPRAVLAMADGGLLALGSRQLLYWQPGWKHTKSLARPSLLPGVELFADAQQPDRFWVFDGAGAESRGPPLLSSYRVVAGAEGVPLPEQTIELSAARGGVLGTTREKVWVYLSPGRQERLAPGGQRLPGASLPQQPLPTWLAPARRLEQALWLTDAGELLRVLVAPTFKPLGEPLHLPGRPFAFEVGDEGRLAAALLVTGEGPQFELELRDGELEPLARVALPTDAPTGADDWLQTVTENQMLAVDPRSPRVAVGGPDRLAIFDGQGHQLFSKASP